MPDFEVGDSYYDVLDVSPEASDDEIQQAWVSQTKEIHADKTGDSERYEYLLDAGKVLKDEEKRQAYTVLGHDLFVDRYGRRGNTTDIDEDDLDPGTADIPSKDDEGTNKSDTDTQTESQTTSTSSSTSQSSQSTKSRESRSGSHRTNSDPRASETRGSHNHTNSTDTDTRTRSDSGSRDTNTKTTETTQTTAQSTGNESEKAESEESSTSIIEKVFSFALISPMVSFPVSSRVVAVMVSVLSVWFVSGEIGVEGSGFDLIAMIVVGAALFAGIRWMPDYIGARYPRKSVILSRIPLWTVVAAMGVAAGVSSFGDYGVGQTLVYANVVSMFMIGFIGTAAVMFGIFGLVLSVVGLAAGGDRSLVKPVVLWSSVLGVVTATGFTVSVTGQPRETILVEVVEIDTYLWSFVTIVPEYVLHGPMLVTVLLSFAVTAGTIGAFVVGTLLLFHVPQRHAHQSWHVRPTVWEIAASIPVFLFAWGMIYQDISEVPLFEPHLGSILIIDGGIVDFVLLPFCAVLIAFTVKDLVEPKYSEWRDS